MAQIVRLPALVDAHVHLRTPGGEHKEDFVSGSKAALAGGFGTVLAMPNTTPPLVTVADWEHAQERADAEALVEVHHFCGASPEHLDELPDLAERAVGLKLYLDQTFGPLRMTDDAMLRRCFSLWPTDKVIALHAEGESMIHALDLAAEYGQRVHVCHVSRRSEIELIARVKAKGVPVTCEVTPHHLFLDESDAEQLGPLGDMRPRLARKRDVATLWDHLETTIDIVATDHAPHTIREKRSDAPPPGVPGLETAVPLLLTAVQKGWLTLDRMTELLAHNPRAIFGLGDDPESWTEVDLQAEHRLGSNAYQTKCDWSPFQAPRSQAG